MRMLLVAIATLGLAAAGQSFAQPEQADRKAGTEAAVSVKDPANPTHDECKSVMGRKMDGRVMHDHSAMKGTPGVAMKKPLSKAQMDDMHGKCAAKIAEGKK